MNMQTVKNMMKLKNSSVVVSVAVLFPISYMSTAAFNFLDFYLNCLEYPICVASLLIFCYIPEI